MIPNNERIIRYHQNIYLILRLNVCNDLRLPYLIVFDALNVMIVEEEEEEEQLHMLDLEEKKSDEEKNALRSKLTYHC